MTTKNLKMGFFESTPFYGDVGKIASQLDKIHTPYIWANPRKCKACWKCVDYCPKQVIGRVGFLWHKHVIINKPESCTGCKKCIQVCPCGVFSEEMPDVFKSMLHHHELF
jgi:uncharacterized Fe-S center protein